MSSSDWMEITVPATVASADDVAALLADEIPAAALGLEIRADEIVFFAPMAEYESVLAHTRETAERLAREFHMPVRAQDVSARPAAPESEWRDAWKRYFHVTRLSERITVVPSWESHEPEPGEIVLELDPGHAFGTGAHASTRLLLQDMDELAAGGANFGRVLDVGTGSGILAIAAAKLWPACQVLAVDIDDLAVSASTENCERNGVADRIRCAPTPVGDIRESFDLVLANIQSSVLLELVHAICDRVAPGGALLLSGLLHQQARDLAEAYARARPELSVQAVRQSPQDAEWASVRLRRG